MCMYMCMYMGRVACTTIVSVVASSPLGPVQTAARRPVLCLSTSSCDTEQGFFKGGPLYTGGEAMK